MATKWNSNVAFPKDNYIVRCTEAIFGASKRTDNPMITFGFELVSPETITVNGKEYTVAGTPLKHYAVTAVLVNGQIDMEKTAGCSERLEELYKKFGLDFSTFNPENPDLQPFVGKTVWALMAANKTEKRRDPTDEQKAKGELGSIIKDPLTGQDQVNYYPQIESFYGEATL